MINHRTSLGFAAIVATVVLAATTFVATGFSSRPDTGPNLATGPAPSTTAEAPTTVTPPRAAAVPITAGAPTKVTARSSVTAAGVITAPRAVPAWTSVPRPPAPRAALTRTFQVTPHPSAVSNPTAPAVGASGDYSLIGYRWNPCQAITVSSTGPDVSAVVAELAGITGLNLQMVGSGGEITVAWGATPAGGEVGQAEWRSSGPWLVSATVTLNLVAGLIYMPTLVRHELGHALGLGHASRPNEIMYGVVHLGSPTDYQPGDLAGLRAVGSSAGC